MVRTKHLKTPSELISISECMKSPADFTQLILSSLNMMGWSVEQFGYLYGKAVKNKAYTKERMYQMIREDAFPEDPTRRWIIARLLQIPPMAFGVSTLNALLPPAPSAESKGKASALVLAKYTIDREEYAQALSSIEQRYSAQSAKDCLDEIRVRMRRLHDEGFYKVGEEGRQIKMLACGYQMAAGNVFRDLFHTKQATRHLQNAVILSGEMAKEGNYADLPTLELYVNALIRRGVLFFDMGKISAYTDPVTAQRYFHLALHDFQAAHQQRDRVDLPLKGDVISLAGTTLAYIARDKSDRAKALKEVLNAEVIVQKGNLRDKGIYYLDLASAFMAPPIRALHDLSGTFSALEEARKYIHLNQPRRYVFMHIIEAYAHFEKKWYPTAVQTLREALAILPSLQSGVHLARAANLMNALQESDYGKSVDVAELQIDLMKVQYPYLFSS